MAPSDPTLPKARRDGGSLVAAFPSSTPPLIWQIDLDRYHTFSLVLNRTGAAGFEIGFVSPKEGGDLHSIARFANEEDAEDAFEELQQAILTRKAGFWNFFPWIGGAVLGLAVLLFLHANTNALSALHLGGAEPQPVGYRVQSRTTANGATSPAPVATPAAVPINEGVPQSANDVLQPPP